MANENSNQGPGMEKIFNEWQRQWDTDASQCAEPGGSRQNSFFISLYEAAYRESIQKMEHNKRWNIYLKKMFVYIVFAGVASQAVLFVVTAKTFFDAGDQALEIQRTIVGNAVALDALLLLTVAIMLLAVSKWVGVKKYQETWARHAFIVSLYQQAMLLYLQEQPMDILPFPGLERVSFPSTLDKQQTFQLRILQIMGKNQEKFTVNIGEKETHLMEDIAAFLK